MIREDELTSGPQVAPRLEVAAVGSAPQLAGMRAEWDALLDASDAGPVQRLGVAVPVVPAHRAGRRPLVLTARDRAGHAGGAHAAGAGAPLGDGPARCGAWRFLGETHVGSDYLDVVARAGREEEVARAFVQGLTGLRDEWDVLDLTDLREGSLTLGVLREVFPARTVRVTERYVCPYETLVPGEPFDAFLKRTGRRDNYLRRRKWLEKQEGYRIERTEAPGALAGPMTDFFRLHALRWSADGGSQGIKGAGVEAFHRDATQLLAERGPAAHVHDEGGRPGGGLGVRHPPPATRSSTSSPAMTRRGATAAWGWCWWARRSRTPSRRASREYDFLRGTETLQVRLDDEAAAHGGGAGRTRPGRGRVVHPPRGVARGSSRRGQARAAGAPPSSGSAGCGAAERRGRAQGAPPASWRSWAMAESSPGGCWSRGTSTVKRSKYSSALGRLPDCRLMKPRKSRASWAPG